MTKKEDRCGEAGEEIIPNPDRLPALFYRLRRRSRVCIAAFCESFGLQGVMEADLVLFAFLK